MNECKEINNIKFFDEKYERETLLAMLGDLKDISEDRYKKILDAINSGQLYDFSTGYPSFDKPWKKFFKMSEFYKIYNDKTIYQDIVENNKNHMNIVALMYFGAKIKYKELFKNIDKAASALVSNGVKKGDFVTVCCAGIPELVYTVYALAKIGAVANLMAPYFDKSQMVERINDCGSKLFIVMDSFYQEVKDSVSKSCIERVIVIPTLNSSPLRFLSREKKCSVNGSNEVWWNSFIREGHSCKNVDEFLYEPNYPLCMVYSSGTTGASKAIMLSHDSFQYSVLSYKANTVDISVGARFYQIVPPWYSTGLNASIHLTLHSGMTVFQDPRFEREIFVNNIIKYKLNYAIAPTSMYEGFLDDKLIAGKKLTSLKNPFQGGEPLTGEVKAKIEANLKKMGCNTTLRIGYGQCECGATATSQTQKLVHPDGSVGIPIPGVTISIFDDDFKELKYNNRGNILINTPCGMLFYYKKPEATSDYFHYDKYGRRWNCTGDIGYMDENGDLFIEGRREDYTVVNNKKVYNFDIESPIKRDPDIKVCDCIARKNDSGGEDLAVHIVFDSTRHFSSVDLVNKIKQLQQGIWDEYHDIDMVPEYFKIREDFPYKPSGKRDIESLGNEVEGFLYSDKAFLLGK